MPGRTPRSPVGESPAPGRRALVAASLLVPFALLLAAPGGATTVSAQTTTKTTAKTNAKTTAKTGKTTAKTTTRASTRTATTAPKGSAAGAATGALDAATVAAARGLPPTRKPASGDPYRFGLLVPAPGADPVVAATAAEQRRGIDLAIEFLNELGGIGGRPISVVAKEAGPGPAAAVGFTDLLDASGVHAVIGPTLSSDVAAIAPQATARRTVLLGASVSARGVPQLSPWVRRVALPGDLVARRSIGAMLAARPSTKVAVVVPPGDAGLLPIARAYRAELATAGNEVVQLEEPFGSTADEIELLVNEIGATSLDLLVVVAPPQEAALLVRTLRSKGQRVVVMVDPSAVASTFARTCSTVCDGVFTALVYDPEDVSTYARAVLLRRYHDAYGAVPTLAAAQGFAALQVVAIGLDDALAANPKADLASRRSGILDALRVGRYDTPIGLLRFDESGEVDVSGVSLGMIRIPGSGAPTVSAVTTTTAAPRLAASD